MVDVFLIFLLFFRFDNDFYNIVCLLACIIVFITNIYCYKKYKNSIDKFRLILFGYFYI